MEFSSLYHPIALSLSLGLVTALLLLPLALGLARWLSGTPFRGKSVVEAALLLPLVLPPVVLGFYLLIAVGHHSSVGQVYHWLTGRQLAFSFDGLVLASLLVNLPFALQPLQRSFAAIPQDIREAAALCGLRPWQIFYQIEWPLIWPGALAALVLVFAHTLGEFGVVLMLGGNIPGQTQTISIAIYDSAQALDLQRAHTLSALLVGFALCAMSLTFYLQNVLSRRHLRVPLSVETQA